jgi:hypothetical protein
MHDERLPKLALKYQPVGKRSRGRLEKKMERPVLGKELINSGLISLGNNSSRIRTWRVNLHLAKYCVSNTTPSTGKSMFVSTTGVSRDSYGKVSQVLFQYSLKVTGVSWDEI